MYYNEREDAISSQKKDEIEMEVRRYVNARYYPTSGAPVINPYLKRISLSPSRPLRCAARKASVPPSWGRCLMTLLLTCNHFSPLSLEPRLLKAGESRVVTLLKSKEEELHRVSNQNSLLELLAANRLRALLCGFPWLFLLT